MQIIIRQFIKFLRDNQIRQTFLRFSADRENTGQKVFGVLQFGFGNFFIANPVQFVRRVTGGSHDQRLALPDTARNEIIAEVTSKWRSYGLPGSGRPIWK